jgi:2-oxoglutarate/2-oxoacid ferredoxin oxidoreductase subunit alpha
VNIRRNSGMSGRRELLQGNEAIVEGAIAAGVRFYAGYPITPATEVLEYFALRMPQVGGAFIQMEDELSALSSVIGASVAGAKAMTATSGPGMSLMSENIGMAIIEEIPCVIVDVQRLGPGSGMIFTSQGDVMYAKWGTPGGNEIIALAPSSVKECFSLTVRAVNLAERFRVPVFLLSDSLIGHLREMVDLDYSRIERVDRKKPSVPPEKFATFDPDEQGIPAMADLGTSYRSSYTAYMHDKRGVYGPAPEDREKLVYRLHHKILDHLDEIEMTEETMLEDADIAVFAYGICARVAKAAVEEARRQGIKVGIFRPITLWPFPEEAVRKLGERVKKIVVAEMNFGQMVHEVERTVKESAHVSFVGQNDGTLMGPERIVAAIKEA